jgi:hypothetical protein
MNTGKDPATPRPGRTLLLALSMVAVTLPAASMNSASMNGGATADLPVPSTDQRTLIEAHDTVGVGWWSSPAMDIDPACDEAEDAYAPLRARTQSHTQAPANSYPRRSPGG